MTPTETARGAIPLTQPTKLTRREREILDLLAEGLTNGEIAERLFVSKRTIMFHVENLFHKFGVHNRVKAINEARRRGILDR